MNSSSSRIPLLAGLRSGDLTEIATLCAETLVRPGARLVAAGESGFSFSMSLSGKRLDQLFADRASG